MPKKAYNSTEHDPKNYLYIHKVLLMVKILASEPCRRVLCDGVINYF